MTALFMPKTPEDPPVEAQIHDLCCACIQQAGGYLVDHPEQHATTVVFGAHQYEIVIRKVR